MAGINRERSMSTREDSKMFVPEIRWTAAVVSFEVVKDPKQPYAVFIVEVTVSNESYRVRRRYSQFKKLHEELQRRFHGLSLPEVPSSRFSRSFDEGYLKEKQLALNELLTGLRSIPKVALSEVLIKFLQEDPEMDEMEIPESQTAVGQLLAASDWSTELEIRSGEKAHVTQKLLPGDYIAWEFRIKQYDIGFSASFGPDERSSDVVVEYVRWPGREAAIQGSYNAQTQGVFILAWDNSYSRVRAKYVQYRLIVVNSAVAEAAATAEEEAKVKLRSRRAISELLRPRTVITEAVAQDESSTARASRDRALAELEEAQFQRDKAKDQASKFRMQLEEVLMARDSLDNDLQEQTSQKLEAQAMLRATEKSVRELRHQVSQMQAELDALRVSRQSLEGDKADLQQELDKQEEAQQNFKLKMDVMAASISSLMAERDALKAERDAAKATVAELTSRIAGMQDGRLLKDLESRYLSCQEELRKALEESEQRLEEGKGYRATAEQLEDQVRQLESQVSKLQAQKKVLVKEVKQLRSKEGEVPAGGKPHHVSSLSNLSSDEVFAAAVAAESDAAAVDNVLRIRRWSGGNNHEVETPASTAATSTTSTPAPIPDNVRQRSVPPPVSPEPPAGPPPAETTDSTVVATPRLPLNQHKFLRFEPLFKNGDPTFTQDVQVWSQPVLHDLRQPDLDSVEEARKDKSKKMLYLSQPDQGAVAARERRASVTAAPPAGKSPPMTRRASVVAPVVTPSQANKSVWSVISSRISDVVAEIKEEIEVVASNAPPPILRFNVTCSQCGEGPLHFIHWKCAVCANHILCHSCYRLGYHGFERPAQHGSSASLTATAATTTPSLSTDAAVSVSAEESAAARSTSVASVASFNDAASDASSLVAKAEPTPMEGDGPPQHRKTISESTDLSGTSLPDT